MDMAEYEKLSPEARKVLMAVIRKFFDKIGAYSTGNKEGLGAEEMEEAMIDLIQRKIVILDYDPEKQICKISLRENYEKNI